MARYLEDARKLHDNVEHLLALVEPRFHDPDDFERMLVQLGYIINGAILCNPRKPQGTVRCNIVAEAMRGRCQVSMTKEPYTRRDGSVGTYNKIHIEAI